MGNLQEENQIIQQKQDQRFMREAIRQAKKALALGDVPIGCVIEYEGKIIGRGYNRRMADKTVLAHAELIAIKKACRKMGDWRLEGCTMYVTLEPCPMCAGAIVQARIPAVVIGCMNPKAGAPVRCWICFMRRVLTTRWKRELEFWEKPVLPCFLISSGISGRKKQNRKRSRLWTGANPQI